MNTENTLFKKINDDTIAALKSGNKAEVTCLRCLIAKIKDATVNSGKDITDDTIYSCVDKIIKEIDQSIESFKSAGRTEAVDTLNAERFIISAYRPEQLTEDDVVTIIKDAIKSNGFSGRKDMGKVMKIVSPMTKNRADGKFVSSKVMELLG